MFIYFLIVFYCKGFILLKLLVNYEYLETNNTVWSYVTPTTTVKSLGKDISAIEKIINMTGPII